MQLLSAVITTFNNEKKLARCLESIKNIADEIVVVDSFSTDNTEEICKQYRVKFIKQPFMGYIGQKNFALSYATSKYVLCLDEDEALSDDLKKSILKEKINNFPKDAYSMNRCSFFNGKFIRHGAWYPDLQFRLFNISKGKHGGINPQDKVVLQDDASIRHLKGDILHYSYNSLEEITTKGNRYTTIQAQSMFQQNKKAPAYKLFINPLWAFINGYILKLGFLNGADGFFIASSIAYHTMSKYAKLRNLYQNKN